MLSDFEQNWNGDEPDQAPLEAVTLRGSAMSIGKPGGLVDLLAKCLSEFGRVAPNARIQGLPACMGDLGTDSLGTTYFRLDVINRQKET